MKMHVVVIKMAFPVIEKNVNFPSFLQNDIKNLNCSK